MWLLGFVKQYDVPIFWNEISTDSPETVLLKYVREWEKNTLEACPALIYSKQIGNEEDADKLMKIFEQYQNGWGNGGQK